MIIRSRPKRPEQLPTALQNRIAPPTYHRSVVTDDAYELGTILERWERFRLSDSQLSVHLAVLGGSGSGKSKFIEELLRTRLLAGKAFGFWDPHGDTAKSLLAFVAAQKANGDDVLWRKVHHLELTETCVFSFDPVSRAPRRSIVGDYAYFQWLKTRIDLVFKVLMRRVAEANQDVMVRLKRWLKCVLYACLVAIDDENTHVGLNKALVFTDPLDPEFGALYARVERHLPKRVRRNFEKLIATRRPQDQEKWVESTINKLEEALSPLTELVYSQARPSIDIKGIIDRGEFLLIDLKETSYFSAEEKQILGGLLLSEVLAVKKSEENIPEDERSEFLLCVDEVGELLGEDLQTALGATRKWKCPILLGAQDLSTFARGGLDMAAKVLTMCGTVMCFQNTFLEDKRILADRVFCGNLDLFTKRMVEVQRQRGYRILRYDEYGESMSATENWSDTNSQATNWSHAEQIGDALAIASNQAETVTEGGSRKERDPHDETLTRNTGKSKVKSGGTTATKNKSATDSNGGSASEASMQGGGKTQGLTVAHKIVIQPNTVSEFDEDGTLQEGTPELQRARKEQIIHTLGVGQAAVAVRGVREAFVIQVDAVEEWWSDGKTKLEAIRRMKERLIDLHPYYVRVSKRTTVGLKPTIHLTTNGRLNGKFPHPNGATNGHAIIHEDEKNPMR